MKILELILRIVLRLIDILSNKPSDAPPLDNTRPPDGNSVNSGVNQSTRNGFSSTVNPTESRNIVVYNEEVRDIVAKVMARHKATEEADMEEIIRLRKRIRDLEEELLMTKSNITGSKENVQSSLQGDDEGSEDNS